MLQDWGVAGVSFGAAAFVIPKPRQPEDAALSQVEPVWAWWFRRLDHRTPGGHMPRIDHSATIADLLEFLSHLSNRPRSEVRTYHSDMALDALIERGWH